MHCPELLLSLRLLRQLADSRDGLGPAYDRSGQHNVRQGTVDLGGWGRLRSMNCYICSFIIIPPATRSQVNWLLTSDCSSWTVKLGRARQRKQLKIETAGKAFAEWFDSSGLEQVHFQRQYTRFGRILVPKENLPGSLDVQQQSIPSHSLHDNMSGRVIRQ